MTSRPLPSAEWRKPGCSPTVGLAGTEETRDWNARRVSAACADAAASGERPARSSASSKRIGAAATTMHSSRDMHPTQGGG